VYCVRIASSRTVFSGPSTQQYSIVDPRHTVCACEIPRGGENDGTGEDGVELK
jgi:hypothetical protein